MGFELDYSAWRCTHEEGRFCPDEGCPKWFGCARIKGWIPGQPNPAYATASTELEDETEGRGT